MNYLIKFDVCIYYEKNSIICGNYNKNIISSIRRYTNYLHPDRLEEYYIKKYLIFNSVLTIQKFELNTTKFCITALKVCKGFQVDIYIYLSNVFK